MVTTHNHEASTSINGAIVYWSCSNTSRSKLALGLMELDLLDHLPNARTERSALYTALLLYAESKTKLAEKNVEYEPKKLADVGSNGFEVVQITHDEDRNHYAQEFTARIAKYEVPNGDEKVIRERVEVDRGWADRAELQDLYQRARAEVTGAAVGGMLVSLVTKMLGGVCLRESGGVYWLPEDSLERFRQIATVVEGAAERGGRNAVYLVRTARDADAVKAIRDAIVAEITRDAEAIRDEVEEGELGESAIENRKVRAAGLRNRIVEYEEFIGETLEGIREVVAGVEQSLIMSALQGV